MEDNGWKKTKENDGKKQCYRKETQRWDFICYPYNRNATCLILELKVDDTAESAVRQIKEKGYALRFQGKLGDDKIYTGDILAIGIDYWKDSKEHE